MKPPVVLSKERDFGLKINAVFDFLGQNFKPLMLSLLYIAGPMAIVAGIFSGVYQSNMLSVNPLEPDPSNPFQAFERMFTLSYWLLIGVSIISGVFASLTVYSYVLVYEQRGNKPTITPNEVWSIVKSNLLRCMGATFIIMVLLIISFFFVFIPCLYLAVVFSLVYMVMLKENLGFSAAVKRSFYLIQDKWWSTFGLILIVALIQGVIGYIFQVPMMVFVFMKALKVADIGSSVLISIAGVIGTVGQVLTSCLVNLAVVFQYYNLVERRDGTGMLDAIEALGTKETARIERREEEEY
jgi:hypothetical protein